MIRPAELIERKRDGGSLTPDEIAELVLGHARGEIPDYQMAAFCMAVYFRGLSADETLALTERDRRERRDARPAGELGRVVVDKHSTGGVGDKTSLVVGPIVAACGVPFAKMSGRGLGHTGGTLDKLESIPGFRVELSKEEFVEQVRDVGLAIIGQTADLVPADKQLYALRDVTGDRRQHPADRGEHHVEEDRRRRRRDRARRQGRRRRLHEVDRGRAQARRVDDRARARSGPRGRLAPDRHGPAARAGRSGTPSRSARRVRCSPARIRLPTCSRSRFRRRDASSRSPTSASTRRRAHAAPSARSRTGPRSPHTSAGSRPRAAIPRSTCSGTHRSRTELTADRAGFVAGVSALGVGRVALELGAGRRTKEDTIDHAVGIRCFAKRGDAGRRGPAARRDPCA